MDKLSNEDKMHIQSLHEQGFRAKAITTSYPDKNCSLGTLQTICRHIRSMSLVQLWRVVKVSVGWQQIPLKKLRMLASWSVYIKTSQVNMETLILNCW